MGGAATKKNLQQNNTNKAKKKKKNTTTKDSNPKALMPCYSLYEQFKGRRVDYCIIQLIQLNTSILLYRIREIQ
jgi:hypothetical protein